ncbi:MAG: GlsB/YeaQ/YmgE family stress response membrane protein [Deltaproteobacteria bacterium]|nr:MAG: GlsB/YeaQ/YmgE family stress response membrane protein [Deltaproteobacteria bacterium]
MGLIMWLVVGGIVGWLASIIMKTDAQQGIVLNVVVGIAGSFLAGLVGARSINSGITIGSILVSTAGAVALLALINLIRRGRVR